MHIPGVDVAQKLYMQGSQIWPECLQGNGVYEIETEMKTEHHLFPEFAPI